MLGEIDRGHARADAERPPAAARHRDAYAAARRARPRRRGPSSRTCRSTLYPGEVLGVVALEGQGQDELFDILAGRRPPESRRAPGRRQPVSFRHPADAIRAGLVYVAADRAEALLMQRSVRENIALPDVASLRRWGLIDLGRRARQGPTRPSTRCRSTRAPAPRSGACRAATSRR